MSSPASSPLRSAKRRKFTNTKPVETVLSVQPRFALSKERLQQIQFERSQASFTTNAAGTTQPRVKEEKKWYAVANGREIGIYRTWDECKEQVLGFRKAKYRSFYTEKEAIEYLDGHGIMVIRNGQVLDPMSALLMTQHSSSSSSSSMSTKVANIEQEKNVKNNETPMKGGKGDNNEKRDNSIPFCDKDLEGNNSEKPDKSRNEFPPLVEEDAKLLLVE